MNGDDVALIRNDLKHLAEMFQEFRTDYRNCTKEDAERFANLERYVIDAMARAEAHEREHKRISQRLGALSQENHNLSEQFDELRRDMKKWSAIGGMASGGGLTGLVEILRQLVK